MRSINTIARTCLQDAEPTHLGETFGAYAAALTRRIAELARSVDDLSRVNLGGTAIGSGSGAPASYRRAVLAHLNRITGRRLRLRDNLYDAAQNMDDLVAAGAQLALLVEVFIKIAQDLRLLAFGPRRRLCRNSLARHAGGFVVLSGQNQSDSARDPSALQCCFQVLGCERAMRVSLEQAELNLNVFEGAAAVNLFDAIEMLQRAVTLFVELCVKRITANEDRCRKLAARVAKTRLRASSLNSL